MKTTNTERGYTVLGRKGSDLMAVGLGYANTSSKAGLSRVEAWECVKRSQAEGYSVRVLKDLVQVWHG